MTTLDGYPMTQRGQSIRALRVAHLSSASGDTFSDVVLILCAPFLAILVERYLDLLAKTALLLLSVTFIAAVVGNSVAKGLISAAPGLLAVFIGTGEDFSPRLTLGYGSGAKHFKKKNTDRAFGDGVPEGIAATEAANSSVSGANLIPVLSLGIPGNAAAVF